MNETPSAGMREVNASSRRERRSFLLVSVVCCGIAIAPIWVTRFLPVLDDPNHLSAMYIWQELGRASSPLHAFYALNIAPVSYFLYYGLVHAIGWLLGVELAHKLVLSLYVIAFPAIGCAWCRETGRSLWLGLLTLPFAFSIAWAHGYHPFNLGMVAFLGSIVLFDRLAMATSARACAAASLGALACYFSHPFPLALLCLCAPLIGLVHGATLARMAWLFAALVPSLCMLVWQAHAGAVNAGSAGSVLGGAFPVHSARVLWNRLLDWPEHAVNAWTGYGDSLAALVLVLFTLLCWVVGARRGSAVVTAGNSPFPQGGSATFARAARALWIASLLALAYFVLPEHFNEPVYMWIARGRIAPAIGFFLVLSAPVAPRSRMRWIAAATALALSYLPIELAVRYRAFGRYMHGMEQVLTACPESDQVLTLRFGDHGYAGFDVPVFRELPSWVQIVHGGYSPMAFPRPVPFPFRTIKELPAPFWRRHDLYKHFLDPNVYGCVLTHRQTQESLGPNFVLARELGPWRLYLLKRATER